MASTGVTKIAAVLVAIACIVHCACSVPVEGSRQRRDADETRQSQELETGRMRRDVEIKMPWVLDSLTQKVQANRNKELLRTIIENEDRFARVGRK